MPYIVPDIKIFSGELGLHKNHSSNLVTQLAYFNLVQKSSSEWSSLKKYLGIKKKTILETSCHASHHQNGPFSFLNKFIRIDTS